MMDKPIVRGFAAALAVVAAVYVAAAYEFVPSAWRFVERRHPALDDVGSRAFTATGAPGDPLNIAFLGDEDSLQQAMARAGWAPADPITLRSSLRIVVDSVIRLPYDDAPVSDLFVNGQKQHLAFEQSAANNPSKRHHVRYWRMLQTDALGRILWLGAATFDTSVGFSHTTGQVTHHIAADVDAERDKLLDDIQRTSGLRVDWIDNFQPEHDGRNGGGDPFHTDGRMAVIHGAAGPVSVAGARP